MKKSYNLKDKLIHTPNSFCPLCQTKKVYLIFQQLNLLKHHLHLHMKNSMNSRSPLSNYTKRNGGN